MQQVAEQDKFRKIFYGLPTIGGRYSALSDFGMVPAAIMGIDVQKFLSRTEEMVYACSSCVATDRIPAWCWALYLALWRSRAKTK